MQQLIEQESIIDYTLQCRAVFLGPTMVSELLGKWGPKQASSSHPEVEKGSVRAVGAWGVLSYQRGTVEGLCRKDRFSNVSED